MEKGLKNFDQIKGDKKTFDAIISWVKKGNIKVIPPRVLEYGIIMISDKEYLLFKSLGISEIAEIVWYKNDEPFAKFTYDVYKKKLDNIATSVELEETEKFYEAFFNAAYLYIGVNAFILKYGGNDKAVRIDRNLIGKRTFVLEKSAVELSEMSEEDNFKGQIAYKNRNNPKNWI